MAEENDQTTDEQTPEQQAGEETAAQEASGAQEQAAAAPEQAAAAPEQAAAAPEQLSPKERRARRRARKAPSPPPAATPEERQAQRLAARRAKAAARRHQRVKDREKAAERRRAAGPVQEIAPVRAQTEGRRKVRQGIVVSDRADKTITVRVDIARRHRRYEKIVRSSGTLRAHDENNDAHIGDTVRVVESRPLSRTKRWRLVDVLERAE